MLEVARGGAECGRTIPRPFLRKTMRDTDRMTPYLTSIEALYRLLDLLDQRNRRALTGVRAGQ